MTEVLRRPVGAVLPPAFGDRAADAFHGQSWDAHSQHDIGAPVAVDVIALDSAWLSGTLWNTDH
ncbi:hypothetical protein [Haloactinomyces albus]|uniref:Uncharacterized protein n=1 Tax=Haloactinomyces albus TaxID=1352928 RepID=A0AAE3ZGF2_9ACTN|nr:hypothetical protein [Haloactinomyces albus]MDR7304382.1 hypothetical protein [Haloactinomyces albus]